jgi:hypothetical protein
MRNLGILLVAGCVVVPAVGCGKGNPNTAKVKGTITYKNAPVKGGVIRFLAVDGSAMAQGPISIDGTYEITDLPPGKKTVVIDTELINPNQKTPAYGGGGGGRGKTDKLTAERMKATKTGSPETSDTAGLNPAAKKEMMERYVKIPAKYTTEKLSPLSVELEAGWNTFDITLTD